ncbi:noc2p family [Tasmannia lanceolata]|uniref:noc2p family n=1 Tax=Tasmannia lanceolata TaxID=3420 RepID=UPI0040635F91
MGKLGKKARKFAQKHLQSVLKKRRQFKSIRDKRKRPSRDGEETAEDHVRTMTDQSTERNAEGVFPNGAVRETSLDNLFSEDDNDSIDGAPDSDGFLSEDLNCPYIADSENEIYSEGKSDGSAILGQNREIHLELIKQKRKLDRLRKKDPKFSKFLETHIADLERFRGEETPYSDDEGVTSDQSKPTMVEGLSLQDGKVLSSSTIDAWCQLVVEQQSMSVLPNLLNGFRAACHFGTDESDTMSYRRIQNKEAFCKILMFVLREADGIFRKLLGVSSCKKDTILELKNTSKWKIVRPLIKSYLRSTLYLLNQVTDHHILDFTLSRLRASVIFFAAFPSLLRRLVKVAVHLWVAGGETLSVSSFFIIQDMAVQLKAECLDTCLVKSYKAFIANCKFVDPKNLRHIQFLGDSITELYSLDIQKSYPKALVSIQQLASILKQALQTKKKETLKRIYNWQYTNCIDLWVKFISVNIKDHDLQPLLYLVIQIINGVAHLFPGPRYLPLRLKCIQMLNQLSSSSGVFIPIASLVLSSLEYKESSKAGARPGRALKFSTVLKVPKQLLKSRDFQEECVLSVIELLSAHFAQWSYHISFPELATIPLICLRNFHEKLTVETLKRPVKRLIDQVQQNVELVQKKREDVAFSPKDHASVDAFLQLEKSGKNAPFTQYYASILQKSISRNMVMNEKISVLGKKRSRKRRRPFNDQAKDSGAEGTNVLEKIMANSIANGKSRSKNKQRKKQRN